MSESAFVWRGGGRHCGGVRRLSCADCRIESFYRPGSNPDGWSVNARCLDDADGFTLNLTAFDGRNWERNAAGLAHLSLEPS